MKTTFTVNGVKFAPVFENKERGYKTQLVNLYTDEKVPQFNVIDDEKVYVEKRELSIPFADFTRLIAKAGWVAYIPLTRLSTEEKTLNKHEMDKIEYSDHVLCLNGAVVTIERDEIRETVYDETKPLSNEDGTSKLDENDEQIYAPQVDKNGNPVTKTVGYKDLRIISVKLTDEGTELAKHHAFTKNQQQN